MKVTVKHKKGYFRSDFKSTLICIIMFYWYKFLFVRRVRVSVEMNQPYYKTGVDQNDWCKVFGAKTGVNTETNHEMMLAYRYSLDKEWETAIYLRLPNEGFDTFDERKGKNRSDVISLIGFLPVFPWAGGNTTPKNDYSYILEVKRL